MTLIIASVTPHTAWMCADRSLFMLKSGKISEYANDAIKLCRLQTHDGVGFVGYAGLGRSPGGMNLSDWMTNVFRGRQVGFEHALSYLAEATEKEIPKYLPLNIMPHVFVSSALVNGCPQIYTINLRNGSDGKPAVEYRKHIPPFQKNPYCCPAAGSGADLLISRHHHWKRDLLRLQKRFDRNKTGAEPIARFFAALNLQVSKSLSPYSVGEKCIVAWESSGQRVPRTNQKHFSFDGFDLTRDLPLLPCVQNGVDFRAILDVISRHSFKSESFLPTIDGDKLNEELARLPEDPDDRLK